jgi:trans-aconitate 2-methyltransferase
MNEMHTSYEFAARAAILPSLGLRPPSPHRMGRGQAEGPHAMSAESHREVVSGCFVTTGNRPSATALGFDGEKYRRASTHQKEWGMKLIGELPLTGRERILDLGCGDGALTSQLAARVPDGFVVGIDSAPSMLAAASRQARANLKFELLDMRQLGYDEEFDVVFSNSALHWIKDHRSLLGRVLRALKPGGFARFNFPADGNCATFNRTVQQVMAQPRYAPGFQTFDWPWYMPKPDDYRRLASRFPVGELQVYGENADRHFPDPETMIRWIDQPCLVPFLPCVPPGDRASFRAEVIERMVQATRQPDGPCFELFRRVHVFFRRRQA